MSQFSRENSQIRKERASMSAADDVREMEGITGELADRLVGMKAKLAARAGAVMRAIGGKTTENRALEFMAGRARRVDAWEKENAKRRLEELKEEELRRITAERFQWLSSTVEHLRQTDEEFHRFDVDGLERAIARLGTRSRAVGDTGATEPPDSTD